MFPRFDGLGRRETAVRWLPKEALVVPKPYPPEFRRRALDLLTSGRTVRDVAASSGIAESCLHRWKSLVLMDRGLKSPTPEAVRRNGPNQLWVTDITEHPTREGKLYCCVVLDTTLRRWFDSVAPPHRVSRGGQRWSSSMARGLVMPGVRAA
jgi:transposase-like protein